MQKKLDRHVSRNSRKRHLKIYTFWSSKIESPKCAQKIKIKKRLFSTGLITYLAKFQPNRWWSRNQLELPIFGPLESSLKLTFSNGTVYSVLYFFRTTKVRKYLTKL